MPDSSDEEGEGESESDAAHSMSVCRATVSGTASGENESFEMRPQRVQQDRPGEWEEDSSALWNGMASTIGCAVRSPADENGNFINRFFIYVRQLTDVPPVALDEKGAGYENIDIEYAEGEGENVWRCTGGTGGPVGDISIEVDSITPTVTMIPRGSWGSALATGSFEATCPPVSTFDPAITPVSIQGSWSIE